MRKTRIAKKSKGGVTGKILKDSVSLGICGKCGKRRKLPAVYRAPLTGARTSICKECYDEVTNNSTTETDPPIVNGGFGVCGCGKLVKLVYNGSRAMIGGYKWSCEECHDNANKARVEKTYGTGINARDIPRPLNECMECDKALPEGQVIKLCGACAKKVSAATRNALRGCVKPEDLTSCVRCKNVCQDKRHATLGGGYLCDSCNNESEMLKACDWDVQPKPILEPGEQAPQASAELPKLMQGTRIAGTFNLLGIVITVDLNIT